jgi:hypothetical protein
VLWKFRVHQYLQAKQELIGKRQSLFLHEKKDKIKNFAPSEEAANFIKNRYEISNREIAELGKYFPKEFKEFSKGIEELLG